ncbi:MAG: hypothetical protein JRI59_10315 [Deltaproteobacteria bacterium]|nr:hypothetical protein [Deltaproteobacteria bacterium]
MTGWLASLGRHKGLKLLSLLLAVALWFAVGGEERSQATLNLNLELVNLSPDLMITNDVPPSIQVRVSGPRRLIRSLSETRLVHTVNLAGVKAGRYEVPLGPGSFSFPRDVLVTRVQPNPLVLTLAPTITRTLPIKPALVGQPPQGYEVKSIKVRPDHVTVKGVASELAKLEHISTLPIDLANLSGPVTLATDLDFKNLHLTLKEPATILVDLVITEKIITRTLTGIQIYARPQAAKLRPSTVTVTLSGPYRRLTNLKTSELLATVNTENLKPGRHTLEVSVQVPEGLRLVGLSPRKIKARLAKPS